MNIDSISVCYFFTYDDDQAYSESLSSFKYHFQVSLSSDNKCFHSLINDVDRIEDSLFS